MFLKIEKGLILAKFRNGIRLLHYLAVGVLIIGI